MDFSQLTTAELSEFININQLIVPTDRKDQIILADKIFGRDRVAYTVSVVDLYIATNLIAKNNTHQYGYSTIKSGSLKRLSPIFRYFDLAPNEENRDRLIHILSLGKAIKYDLNIIENLPDELIKLVYNKLSDKDLINVANTSSRLNTIYKTDEFWHCRYDIYFGEIVRSSLANFDWFTIYKKYTVSKVVHIPCDTLLCSHRIFPTDTFYEIYYDICRLVKQKSLVKWMIHYNHRNDFYLNVSPLSDKLIKAESYTGGLAHVPNYVGNPEVLPNFNLISKFHIIY